VPGAQMAVSASPRVLRGRRPGLPGGRVERGGCGHGDHPARPVGPPSARPPSGPGPARQRMARLIAETTARSEALTIELSTPTPQSTVPSTAHST
jgi:hypothetical protein